MNPFFHAILEASEQVKDVTEIGETLAYTWFGRPNYAYSEEAQKYWIGSTKDTSSGTTQHVTEYDILNDTYTTTQVGTVYQKDDHNQAQLLIRHSDKRLIAFYVEHNGLAIRWRISVNPLDSSLWGDESAINPLSNYSYVSPYQSSNGNIYIFFRVKPGMDSDWYYCKSEDGGISFGSPVKFYDDNTRMSYLITHQDGDLIHFAASNGSPQTNFDININVYHFHFIMATETFHKTNGDVIASPFSSGEITLLATTLGNDTGWILDISCKNNRPRILHVVYPEGMVNDYINKELWYAEWNGSSWATQKVADTMSGYIEDDLSLQNQSYTGASRFDTSNSDIIWMPKQVNGILEIHKVDLRITPIYIEQITFNSEVNNWRPTSVPSSVNNLLWLKNNHYNMFTDYDITLQTKTVQV